MLQKVYSYRKILNIVKLLGAVFIIYFGFKLFVGNIGENIDFLHDKLYPDEVVSTKFYDKDWTDGLGIHNISKTESKNETKIYNDAGALDTSFDEKYQKLCLSNTDFCVKMKYDGTFSSKDKFMYLASSVYVLNAISENIQFGIDVVLQLKAINVNADYGATRGTADWNSITINLGAVASYTEFLGLIAHEMGHVVDLGVIRGYSENMSNDFTEFGKKVFSVDDPSLTYYKLSWQSEFVRKFTAIKEDFCSGYGMTDPFEDFAECHNIYLNHNAIFRERAKNNEVMSKKYNFFANLYNGKYLFYSESDLARSNFNCNWRPWDTTKM